MNIVRKNKIIRSGLILLLTGVFFITGKDAQATSKILSILNDYNKSSCQVDLDGDGKKEKLRLKISRNDIDITKITLQVNGHNALTLQNFTYEYPNTVNISYVNMTKKDIFICVTVSGDNDYIFIDNFYRYDPATRKMTKAVQLLGTKFGGARGTITSVNNSDINITYQCQFAEIGSVKWTSTYIVKNKKLSLKSNVANVTSVYTTDYDPDGYSSLFVKNQFKTLKSLKLYTSTSMKQISYTAKKNEILTLKKIKYTNNTFYVQFSNGNKNGWLKLNSANYHSLFYGVENRLAG